MPEDTPGVYRSGGPVVEHAPRMREVRSSIPQCRRVPTGVKVGTSFPLT